MIKLSSIMMLKTIGGTLSDLDLVATCFENKDKIQIRNAQEQIQRRISAKSGPITDERIIQTRLVKALDNWWESLKFNIPNSGENTMEQAHNFIAEYSGYNKKIIKCGGNK